MLSGEAIHTNCIDCGLARPGIEPTIYRTRSEHANHYVTDSVHYFRHSNYASIVNWSNCDHNCVSVALKTCKSGAALKNGVIQFTYVRLAVGIHNTDSITNSGIFTCEKAGLYLISVYIVTNTHHGSYVLHKNSKVIADAFASLTDYYQTASTTVVEHLAVSDTISVRGGLYVYDDYESCLTILQIQ